MYGNALMHLMTNLEVVWSTDFDFNIKKNGFVAEIRRNSSRRTLTRLFVIEAVLFIKGVLSLNLQSAGYVLPRGQFANPTFIPINNLDLHDCCLNL